MSTARNPSYTPFHPRWYRRRMPIFWWLGHRGYTVFIARELTSIAVAYVAVMLLVQAWVIGRGPDAWARFLEVLAHPAVLVFHGFVLAALVFHTVTWLGLAPAALVFHVRGRRIPGSAIVAAHYGAWLLASAFVIWLIFGR